MGRLTLPPYVLWLDPGATTGWALWYTREQRLTQAEYDWDELVWRLEAWASSARRKTIIGCERFVITPDSARRPGSIEALQVWGAARSAATRHDAFMFLDHQTSSMAKTSCPDEILQTLGWRRNTMGHANDAARHVYRWMCQEGVLPSTLRAKLTLHLEQEGSNDGRGRTMAVPARE